MALVEIVSVVHVDLDPRLRGRGIDRPAAHTRHEAVALPIEGWVVGSTSEVVAVELWHEGSPFRRFRLGKLRPDVHAFLGGVLGAERSGFSGTAAVLVLDSLEVEIVAVLSSGDRAPIGRMTVKRAWRAAHPDGGRVSIIIPSFNHGRFVGEAIESAMAQTYPDVEIVVVDDGSTDNTAEVVTRYAGVRYVQQRNSGVAAARNTGIRRSNGEFLVFLDADDRLLPEAAAIGVETFRVHPEAAMVSGEHQYMDAAGARLHSWERPIPDRDHYAALLRGNYIGPPIAVMFRREALSRVGVFDAELIPCEDYDLYLRVAREFPMVSHERVVAEYRRHGANTSRRGGRMLTKALLVLARQRPFVGSRPELRAAVRAGKRFFRDFYTSELQQQLAAGSERWPLPELFALLKNDPAGFLWLLRQRRRR